MPDVFLSYSREDQATARLFAEGLKGAGFSVWWDQALRSGETYDRVTERALEEASAVVVLWSKASVESKWVRSEATQADRTGTLVPVMIEPCKRPIMFELNQTAELERWQGNPDDPRWRAFVEDLRAVVGGASQRAPEAAPAAPAVVTGRSSRTGLLLALTATALVTAGAGAWLLVRKPVGDSAVARQSSAASSPEAREGPVALAVLPFENLTADPEQQFLADGLAEEIRTTLGQISGLRITGGTSSSAFRSGKEDPRTIGERLGVDHLLEGSVRRDGDRLRLTAKLINAADGFQVWSRTYERPRTEIFAVQDEIARSVAQALEVALGVGDLAANPYMTQDVDAYEAFLSSVQFSMLPEARRRSIAALEEALRRDPDFVEAWMRLADNFSQEAGLRAMTDQERQTLLSKSAAARAEARRRAPDHPGLIRSEMSDLISAGRIAEAWRLAPKLEAAMVRDGEDWSSSLFRGQFLVGVGKARDAAPGLEAARRRDPLDVGVYIFLAEAYANSGDLDSAIETQDRGLEIGGAQAELLRPASLITALAKGDQALIEARIALNAGGEFEPVQKQRADRAEALKALRTAIANAGNPVVQQGGALWAAYLGDPAYSLEVLNRTRDSTPTLILGYQLWRPVMAEVRRLPGFKDLVREMGLVEYWREFGWGEHCRPVGADDFECH
jgi:TolB-like protein